MFRFRTSIFLFFFLFAASSAHAINDVYVVHFVLDGMRADVLNQYVQAGELPHLKEYFIDHGATFKETLNTFPTVSSPGYITFATGLGAGNSGVFFLEWFDRTQEKVVGYLTLNGFNNVNTDLLNHIALMDPTVKELYGPTTLFEKLFPQPTAAIYTPFRKGATIALPKSVPVAAISAALLSRDGLTLDQLAMHDLQKAFSKTFPEMPRYSLVGLYAVDYYAHKVGSESQEVLATLKQFDLSFAKFLDQLKTRGIADKTYIILTSDHGMHATGDVFELRDILWKAGVRDKSVYVSDRGVSSTFLYAKGEKGWTDLPSVERLRHFPVKNRQLDLVKIILDQPQTAWVAVRDGFDAVRVIKSDGEGLIKINPESSPVFYSYSYTGKDPLEFSKDLKLASFLKGKMFSAEQWLQATAYATSPNGVVELANLFQEPRVGDMVIVAKGPWGFRKEKAGTHGSLNQDDMHIPFWVGGPTVPHKTFDIARGVDIFPTVLEWFGFGPETYKNQEGNPLFTPANKLKGVIPTKVGIQDRLKKLEDLVRQVDDPKNPLGICKELKSSVRWGLNYAIAAQKQRLHHLKPLFGVDGGR